MQRGAEMKRLRVLIAEEESVSRNLLTSSLSYWGCDVVTVQNGEQARTALQAGNIDVCILNCDLSKMDGLEICQWMRLAELKAEPYVILLANERDWPEKIRSAYLAGAHDFLTKPFRLEDVRDRISAIASKILKVRSMHRELGRMDPLECYRMDLAFQSKALSRA